MTELPPFFINERLRGCNNLAKIIVDKVRYYGICVVPHFFETSFCEQAISVINDHLNQSETVIWRDKINSDQRIMGIGHLNDKLELRSQPLIASVINDLYGVTPEAGFTMSGYLRSVEGNLGSGQGWHRDTVKRDQYKALVYLSDVEQDNGPFQFILRTFSVKSMQAVARKYGIHETENRINIDPETLFPSSRIFELCAQKGTLIIANTRSIHRGKPILKGARYALTTYYWENKIPPHMVKFVNGNV